MGSKAKTDGVGIFVSEKWVHSVASVERHSERVLVLNMVIGDCLPKCFHGVCSSLRETWSCVCAVAQHAVLEANAKVNGRGPFLHPHPSETPQPISMSCQIYYYNPQASWCAKFGWNRFGLYGSAQSRMHEKNTFCVDFSINISVCLSICLSISSSRLQVTVFGQF